ncbi:hypothetical protein B0H16DRAFT_1695591 [Mycena metata]|uniref:BTB domain-containing protein n=1 Tax=Mycena metata TaxID=1033252 RepID=A0AAD7MWV6_9AGAR|nr:hypothetical protein B0H16DRAFT_1695591 [Mycena metata]
MSDALPSTKRRGTEPDSSVPLPLVRSKIWKPYGDIILQAESTQFRVNRDLLAGQSPVFRDMLSFPQPPNEPTIEGCPIVHVSDTAKDWELFLEVLYNPFQSTVSRPYAVVASMLRLGRKYDMRAPKDDALRRIRAEFPNVLEAYDSCDNELTTIDHEDGVYSHLLNLLYECGVYSAIPMVGMACLSQFSLETLAVTVERDTVVTLAFALERILEFQREKSLSWLHGDAVIPDEACKFPKSCIKQQLELNHLITGREKYPFHTSYTIEQWEDEWEGEFCDMCETAAKEFYAARRREGWDLLPTFFRAPEVGGFERPRLVFLMPAIEIVSVICRGRPSPQRFTLLLLSCWNWYRVT